MSSKVRWKIAQWFELRWWRNYLSDKNKEEYLAWKKNYWKDILSKVLNDSTSTISPEKKLPPQSLRPGTLRRATSDLTPQSPAQLNPGSGDSAGVSFFNSAKTICDLGCGPAGIFIALPENKITAVDPLIDEYEKQTPFFRKADYPSVNFVQSGMEDFETSEKFDLVFCMNAINHVQDIEKGFEQLANVCAANGTVVLSIDAHNFSFFKYLFRLIPGDILHPHQYDLIEYQELLQKQGLKILKTELLKKEFFFNHYLIAAKQSN